MLLPYVLIIMVSYGNVLTVSKVDFETYGLCDAARNKIVLELKNVNTSIKHASCNQRLIIK